MARERTGYANRHVVSHAVSRDIAVVDAAERSDKVMHPRAYELGYRAAVRDQLPDGQYRFRAVNPQSARKPEAVTYDQLLPNPKQHVRRLDLLRDFSY